MTDSELTLEFTTLRRRVTIVAASLIVLLIAACVFVQTAVVGLCIVTASLIGCRFAYDDAARLSRRNDTIMNNALNGEA